MATHSSTLTWRIPWTGEPGRLQSMGLLRVSLTERLHFPALEKEMETHSSVLAWRFPGTAEPGGLLSMGSHRVRHDRSDLAAATAQCKLHMLPGLLKCSRGGKTKQNKTKQKTKKTRAQERKSIITSRNFLRILWGME